MQWPVSNINFEFPKPKWNKSLSDFPFVCVRVLALFICLAYFSELVHWLVVAVYLLKVKELFLHRPVCFSEFRVLFYFRFVCLFVCLGGLFVCLQSSKQTRHDQSLSLMQRCVLVGSLTLQCGVPSSINRLVRLGRYLLAPVKTESRKRNESNMINDYAWCGGAS